MPINPLPDEPTEAIEPLQPKSVPQPAAPQPAPSYVTQPTAKAVAQSMNANVAEAQGREDALTIKFAIEKINDYLHWFVMVLESILLIRFVLMVFGADPANPFAHFIFILTEILRVPFVHILPDPSIHPNQAFEFSTHFAALIYFLIFLGLKRLLSIMISSAGEQGE